MRQGLTLQIAARDWWTSNNRLHRMDEARRTKAVRMTAAWLARLHLDPMPAAEITATICTPTNRRFDAPNAWPMVKAAVDGIVDAGILADDDHLHVPRTAFVRGPKTGERGVYRLTLDLEAVA